MEIRKIDVGLLKAAAYNPRKDLQPGDAEFEKLRRSIEEFGYVEPVIWNARTGNVVGGHQRLKVLKSLGHSEVDCVVVDLDERKEKALNVALNKISGDWDDVKLTVLLKDLDMSGYDVSLTGFDATETNALFGKGALENVREDDFDADTVTDAIKEPVTQRGDIWLLGRHRLLCGDSTSPEEISVLMDGKQADIMVTDPPYNVNYEKTLLKFKGRRNNSRKTSTIQNDNLSEQQFYNFLFNAFYTAHGILRGGASFYVFHSTRETINFESALTATKFKVAQTLVWYKNHFTLGRQDYQWIHEPVLYGWKEQDGCPHYFIDDRTQSTVLEDTKDFKAMKKDELISVLEKIYVDTATTVIKHDKPQRSAEHPTMKPILLCAKFLYNSSRIGETVYEPFGGSGSTLMAAEQLDRTCYACELEPLYCDVIAKRFIDYTGKAGISLLRAGKEINFNNLLKE